MSLVQQIGAKFYMGGVRQSYQAVKEGRPFASCSHSDILFMYQRSPISQHNLYHFVVSTSIVYGKYWMKEYSN